MERKKRKEEKNKKKEGRLCTDLSITRQGQYCAAGEYLTVKGDTDSAHVSAAEINCLV